MRANELTINDFTGVKTEKCRRGNYPATRLVLSTKAIMRQFSLPVLGDCLIPRPI